MTMTICVMRLQFLFMPFFAISSKISTICSFQIFPLNCQNHFNLCSNSEVRVVFVFSRALARVEELMHIKRNLLCLRNQMRLLCLIMVVLLKINYKLSFTMFSRKLLFQIDSCTLSALRRLYLI